MPSRKRQQGKARRRNKIAPSVASSAHSWFSVGGCRHGQPDAYPPSCVQFLDVFMERWQRESTYIPALFAAHEKCPGTLNNESTNRLIKSIFVSKLADLLMNTGVDSFARSLVAAVVMIEDQRPNEDFRGWIVITKDDFLKNVSRSSPNPT